MLQDGGRWWEECYRDCRGGMLQDGGRWWEECYRDGGRKSTFNDDVDKGMSLRCHECHYDPMNARHLELHFVAISVWLLSVVFSLQE
jgi:hypothetical protein